MRAHRRQVLAAMIIMVCGWCFLCSDGLRNWSMDLFFRIRESFTRNPTKAAEDVCIVFLDVNTITNADPFVRLLNDLVTWNAKAVVFDVVFTNKLTNKWWNSEKSKLDFSGALRRATNAGVKVILVSQGGEAGTGVAIESARPVDWIAELIDPEFPSSTDTSGIGVSDLLKESSDSVVRRYSLQRQFVHDPLAVTLARLLGRSPSARGTKWISYYGPPGTFRTVNLKDLVSPGADLPSSFRSKVVFVGQGPPAQEPTSQGSGEADQHVTPLATMPKGMSSGVEIQATAFCNLMHDDWLHQPTRLVEWVLAVGVGVLFGALFTRWRLRTVIVVAFVTLGIFSLGAFLVFAFTGYLLPWAVIVGPQLAAAVATAFIPLKSAFISYRRVDGRNVAVFLTNELNRRGIEAFVDIRDEAAGRLDGILIGQIVQRNNFLLILTPGVIEDWRQGNADWIGQEISNAVALKKTIVPVPVDGVSDFIKNYTSAPNKVVPAEIQQVLSNFKRCSYYSDRPDESVVAIARGMRYGLRKF